MSAAANRVKRTTIIAVGQIPPPVTGYAYITSHMIDALSEQVDVETIDISPGNRRGLRKHLYKARQTIQACWRFAQSIHHPRLTYMGCEGDLGLIYTVTLVATARLFRYNIFLHHHSFSYIDRSSSLMGLLLRAGGKQISHIFLCTTMRDRFEARYGKTDSSYVISNAAFVKSHAASSEPKFSPGSLSIGLLSNLTRNKGLYVFIDLLHELKVSGLDVRGVLAGPVADDEDRAAVSAAESELGPYLEYVGPLYGEAKDNFYRDIDVFVFPTSYVNEAQPTVIFEALAAGKRVLAYDRGCIGNQIGKNGLAIPIDEYFCAPAITYLTDLLRNRVTAARGRSEIADDFQKAKISAQHSINRLMASFDRREIVNRTGPL